MALKNHQRYVYWCKENFNSWLKKITTNTYSTCIKFRFNVLFQVVDRMTNIDGEIDYKKLFFIRYLERWHIKIFLISLDPTYWKVLVVGYAPPVLITLVCSFMRALFVPIDHHDQVIPINHTNVIDIGYWSSVKGLDVYCSAGTETT